jgi:hypothetical protein
MAVTYVAKLMYIFINFGNNKITANGIKQLVTINMP